MADNILKVEITTIITVPIVLYFDILSFLLIYFKNGKAIAVDDKEPNINKIEVRKPLWTPNSKKGNKYLKLWYFNVRISTKSIDEKTSITVIIITIKSVSILLVIKYAAGIIKNNKQYQIGLSRNIVECIESLWTAAVSTEVKNKAKAKMNNSMFPIVFG